MPEQSQAIELGNNESLVVENIRKRKSIIKELLGFIVAKRRLTTVLHDDVEFTLDELNQYFRDKHYDPIPMNQLVCELDALKRCKEVDENANLIQPNIPLLDYSHDNETVTVISLTEPLQYFIRYIERLLDETSDRLVFDPDRNLFKFKGKTMTVRQQERTKSISLNICRLLFEHQATYLNGDEESPTLNDELSGYNIGDRVHLDVLYGLIIVRDDQGMNPFPTNHRDRFKPIREAIRDLNKRAMDSLGIFLFKYRNQEVQVLTQHL